MERLPETCNEILATLPLFAGYDLEAPEMEAVARHLEGCESCRRACDRARNARAVLGSLREPKVGREAGPDLWSGVRSQLVEEGLLQSGPRVARPFAGSRWWMGSAAAAALLVVGLLGTREGGPWGRSDGPVSEVPVPPVQTAVADTTSDPSGFAASDQATGNDRSGDLGAGGAVSRPAVGELVGQGASAMLGGSPGEHAVLAPEGSHGRPLRRLEPGEHGLYEQAVLEAARSAASPSQGGGAWNGQRRLLGVR